LSGNEESWLLLKMAHGNETCVTRRCGMAESTGEAMTVMALTSMPPCLHMTCRQLPSESLRVP